MNGIHSKISVQPSGTLPSMECMHLDHEYGAHNYHPLPIVFSKAQGVHVWDPEGKHYYDFLSAYSAVNQGHCHPKIVQALIDQAQKCTLSSRAFYNDIWGQYAKFVTEYFGFDMVLPMNTGAEGVETALKAARKWGYMKKAIPEGEAIIVCCSSNFHGRTITIISMSDDPSSRDGFGPYTPGIMRIPYNDTIALRDVFEKHGTKVAGFLVEPIQGEAGVVVPDDGYLAASYRLCKEHNVLFIADEIQTGIGRTGRLLACDWEAVKPDILILGKALSGGVYPVSCILSSKEVMLCIRPGEHGSTYGGNPLACAVAMAALEVIRDEDLTAKAEKLGSWFRQQIRDLRCPFVVKVRGKGLLNAFVIDPSFHRSAWEICLLMKHRGLLAKPTHDNIIRLAPPLVITEAELGECVSIIRGVLTDIVSMRKEDIPGYDL
eukprot:CAMPEP_0196655358 /NCGR_PEP_ID=MMETSP1086-20130531/5112_1 /TAXON_ID=77921 /ORGANISM="Cyanoptyche  gloeocystis , Strain SAG4.97" /LENGTH=432 /DNA_ID=CAMNT_0041987627 /DNA_START=56 /DNA_END=1354 /DNA_ORIENTATION=-